MSVCQDMVGRRSFQDSWQGEEGQNGTARERDCLMFVDDCADSRGVLYFCYTTVNTVDC